MNCGDTIELTLPYIKIKVTVVQELSFCTGRTAHRESRGIALPFHDHGIRTGCGVSVMLELFS